MNVNEFEPWIETFKGIKFEFLNPQPDQINIEDIAHSLSMNCRFVGQCSRFYSVAEHSWHVARMLDGCAAKVQLAGLLHDASEAYITDIASPVKDYLPEYKELEDKIMTAIASKYGFEYPLHPAVKLADRTMLSNEAFKLLKSQGNDWTMWRQMKRPTPLPAYQPIGMPPEQAEQLFLDKYAELLIEVRAEEKNEAAIRATKGS